MMDPEDIDALRFKAFRTNSPSDIDAYHKGASEYFQNRHTRALKRSYDRDADRNEIANLREALNEIVGMGFDAPMTWAGTDAEWERNRANAMQSMARAALKGGDV